MARPADPLDQAMPVQNGVDRALGGNAKVAVEPAQQKLADFAGAPMGLLRFQADDQTFDLPRQLVLA
jgi:hypothetical protein